MRINDREAPFLVIPVKRGLGLFKNGVVLLHCTSNIRLSFVCQKLAHARTNFIETQLQERRIYPECFNDAFVDVKLSATGDLVTDSFGAARRRALSQEIEQTLVVV